ncbi:MAG: hypothetical protein WHS44_01895 [Fimbriimonadales bacterium]|nr:MAG: hypothetical protein KatS3mg018_0533 [Fimbriimonadales bacterium]
MANGSRARLYRAAGFVVGLLARAVGGGALFWLIFPLWLSVFWGVQGYPPSLSDLGRWYALGAFNAAPIVATALVGLPATLALGLLRARGRWLPLLGGALYLLATPPLAYALLLLYAEMWRYRAWDAAAPTLMRAYGLVGGAAFVVGWAVGWSVRPSRRSAPAGATARRS